MVQLRSPVLSLPSFQQCMWRECVAGKISGSVQILGPFSAPTSSIRRRTSLSLPNRVRLTALDWRCTIRVKPEPKGCARPASWCCASAASSSSVGCRTADHSAAHFCSEDCLPPIIIICANAVLQALQAEGRGGCQSTHHPNMLRLQTALREQHRVSSRMCSQRVQQCVHQLQLTGGCSRLVSVQGPTVSAVMPAARLTCAAASVSPSWLCTLMAGPPSSDPPRCRSTRLPEGGDVRGPVAPGGGLTIAPRDGIRGIKGAAGNSEAAGGQPSTSGANMQVHVRQAHPQPPMVGMPTSASPPRQAVQPGSPADLFETSIWRCLPVTGADLGNCPSGCSWTPAAGWVHARAAHPVAGAPPAGIQSPVRAAPRRSPPQSAGSGVHSAPPVYITTAMHSLCGQQSQAWGLTTQAAGVAYAWTHHQHQAAFLDQDALLDWLC